MAYISNGNVIGLSKINRLVQYYAKRPQVQERLTNQIADALKEALQTQDVALVIDAVHLCVASRDVNDTSSSTTAAKPLLKKYPSLQKDLLKLEGELINNPTLGTSLGHNAYKIRLKISSKGKGKSGGARVISLVDTILINKITTIENQVTISLITIYDKADTATINDRELKELIKSFYKNE